MTPARVLPALLVLLVASATSPAAASQRAARPPTVMRLSALVTPTDFSASRRRVHRTRHATRVRIYRRGNYSFFESYAPPVPPFFPFGYRQGYF